MLDAFENTFSLEFYPIRARKLHLNGDELSEKM
jgi:hypothetical protein